MAETPTLHMVIEPLDLIREVVISEPNVFQADDLFPDRFSACEVWAGAKLHVVHNVTDDTIDRLDIGDTHSYDSDHLWTGSWLDVQLLMINLAYFKHHPFVRIYEKAGYFLSRLKRSSDPTLVEELRI